jgi:hypothetical protein
VECGITGSTAEARQKQHEKEQARRKRLMKQRAETLDHILDSAPATFTAPQLRVLIRALIHSLDDRQRQEANGCRRGDRKRACRLHLGHRPGNEGQHGYLK